MTRSVIQTTHFLALSLIVAFRSLLAWAALRLSRLGSVCRIKETNLMYIIHSIIPWDGVWQRPQHFAVRLSEQAPVVYVDPEGIHHLWAKRRIRTRCIEVRIRENLIVLKPVIMPGGKTRPFITYFNDQIVMNEIRKHLERRHPGTSVYVTNSPLSDRIAKQMDWQVVAYDIIDDYISASWAPPSAAVREINLFRKADTVFTGTYSLYEKKRAFHADVEFIPCGVEVDHFSKALDPETQIPADIQAITGPILGYFGGLNERLDSELLIQLAESLPECSIVLVGPVFADFGMSRFSDPWASVLNSPESPGFGLKKIPGNIHILGIRTYAELPSYLKAFTICLLPYVINPVTRDIHPVKILEYLASGKPVVSTALPDVERFYAAYVEIARDADDFIRLVRKLLSEGTQPETRRISFARQKTWESMTCRMVEKITLALNQGRRVSGHPSQTTP